ncbi:MAG: hypothetical protein WDN03_19595 [Rhizomicrobium sp.]
MTGRAVAAILASTLFCTPVAAAGGDAALERLLLCQDSWSDWQKTGDPRLKLLAEHLSAAFARHGNDGYFVPKVPTVVLGFRVLQVYPGSVGMGVGFSILVDATFETAQQELERALGKPLKQCDAGDGMKSCEREVAPMRTLALMAQDAPNNTSSLIGCYYFYEK